MWIIYLLLLVSNISIFTGNPGKVGGSKFTEISKVMVIVQMEDAQKVLQEAREASQKHLSKDEIQSIKDKADEVLGSMVQCSSQVIESTGHGLRPNKVSRKHFGVR